jgi:hypothetical protein
MREDGAASITQDRSAVVFGVAGAATLALLLISPVARSDTHYEIWPEIDAFYGINPRTRLLFTAASTRSQETASSGTTPTEAQFSANFDYTLKPIERRDVPEAEWSKNRYLWTRIGYRYVTSLGEANPYNEHTALGELTVRVPLGADVWVADRTRVDLRNINGVQSQRYRARVTVEKEAKAWGHVITPYAQAELYYDTRYSKWSRVLYEAGIDFTITRAWRLEPYLALQVDTPNDSTTRTFAVGLILKYYR